MFEKKRILSLLLCVTIVSGIVLDVLPTKKAYALFGVADIVSDPLTEANTLAIATAQSATAPSTIVNTASTVAGWLDTAWRYIHDILLSSLLATLKKRLLDEITNETIQWIQTGSNNGPLFTGNFSKVLKTAGDQAAGDILQQIGAGQLCTGLPSQLFNIQLAQPQTLGQSVSCTLSQAVGNIEAFKQNFQNGGWIGYQNLLMPQNNQYGLEILTKQALEDQAQKNTQASILQQQVNVGFNSKICTDWTMYSAKTQQPAVLPNNTTYGPITQQSVNTYLGDPGVYPLEKKDDGSGKQPIVDDSNFIYKCTSEKVTTPGRTVADSVTKALGSNIDFIVNSQDISSVLGAVLDAAFNKLVTAGINGAKTGLAGVLSPSSTGISLTTVSSSVVAYTNERDNTINSQQNSISNSLSSLLDRASSTISDAATTLTSASSTNTFLLQSTEALASCYATINASTTDIAWASSTITLASSTYPDEVTKQTNDVVAEALTIGNLSAQYSDKDAITTALSTATQLNTSATTLSNTIGSTITEAQNRLSICVTNRGPH